MIDGPSLLLPPVWVLIPALILFNQLCLQSIGAWKEAGATPPFSYTTPLLPLTLVGAAEQLKAGLHDMADASATSGGAFVEQGTLPEPCSSTSSSCSRVQARFEAGASFGMNMQ